MRESPRLRVAGRGLDAMSGVIRGGQALSGDKVLGCVLRVGLQGQSVYSQTQQSSPPFLL